MISNENLLIEDIRKDSESDLYYKYGYIKNPDGSFIQVGILAEKVHNLLESFRLQNLIDDIVIDSDLVQLYALDRDYRIIASTNENIIDLEIKDEDIKTALINGRVFDQIINSKGLDLYEIFAPIEDGVDNIIGVQIQYSLNDILPVIRNNTMISIAGVIIVYLSLIYAIITTYRRNRKLEEIAYYDRITGLPNTESLKLRFVQNKVKNKNNKAIVMIRCDNLKLMNLSFGYEYGDMLLREFGKLLKTIQNNDIQLYKFTGEKFVFYISNYNNKEGLLNIINKINGLFTSPLLIGNKKEHLSIKIGVIEFKDSDKATDAILKDAAIALNYIGDSASNNFSFFNEKMDQDIQRAEIIEREMRNSINNKDTSRIFLFYQPIINSKTDKIDGFEALARMNSEKFGFVSPAEFIEIAERKQLIIPLSNFILTEACRFMAKLKKSGFSDLHVAVNISTIHLLQESFVNTVLDIIEETGIKGKNIELELTESIFMDNFNLVNRKLEQLRVKGISISLDDFGTGYSSFDRLSELNIDTLKIDQYFINKITDTDRDSLITRDTISIAHSLGLKTVAEGVEIKTQKDYLLKYDCDKLQGFLYSKPVPENDAIKLLKEYNK